MLHPRKDYARIQDPANLIPGNEPVFLLRAQDKAAAITVRCWANANENLGGDPEFTQQARNWADKMEAWPVKKFADLPAKLAPEPIEEKGIATEAGDKASFSAEPPGSGNEIDNYVDYVDDMVAHARLPLTFSKWWQAGQK